MVDLSDNVAHAIAGSLGGIMSMIITYPLLSVSMRTQTSKSAKAKGFQGQIDTLNQIIKDEGVVGLYSGYRSLD
jgi:adenine nucleotide transporter 17